MKLKSLYSSIPVLILGFAAIYLVALSSCGGIDEVYTALGLVVLICLYLLIFYGVAFINFFRHKTSISLFPIVTTVLLVGSCVLAVWSTSERFKNKILLEASNNQPYGMIDLRLRENNQLEFSYGHIEEKCTCAGTYQIQGDTLLIIEMEQKPKTVKTFERYVIGDVYIVPISINEAVDSVNYLKIKKD